jgi:uncharacterized membrane protein YhaH (DUF805 family)
MRWVEVLTGFRGRLRRRDFWLGLLLLVIIEIALAFGFAGLMRPTGATPLEQAAVWPALIVKRLHDRDKSALWYPLFGLAPALCYHLGVVYSGNISNVLSPAQKGFWLLGAVLWIWAIVELGFMPGTPGANRYGPDPRAARAEAAL